MKGLFYFRGSLRVAHRKHERVAPLLRGDGYSAEPFAIAFPKSNIVIPAVRFKNVVLYP